MSEGDERGGRTEDSDDLFENLDSFFEPIDDIGWPDDSSPVVATPPSAEPAPVSAFASESEPEPEPEPEPDPQPGSVGGEVSFERAFSQSEIVEDEAEGPEATESVYERDEALEDAAETQAAVADTEFEAFTERDLAAGEEGDATDATDADAIGAIVDIEDDEYVATEALDDAGAAEAAAEHFSTPGDLEGADIEQEILADLDAPVAEETIVVAATEGLQGPSWQEPMHEEVEVDPAPAPARNVPAAFVTGFALAAVALVALAVDKGLFALLAGGVVLAAQAEFYAALRRRHYQPATLLGLIFGGLILAAGFLKGEAAMVSMLALSVIFTFFWEMATPAKFRKHIVVNIGVTLLGIAYIPLLAGFGFTILAIEPSGRALILAVLGLTFVYDTVAFVVGSWWGETQLAPHISPKKSWQGAIAASFAVVILSVLFVSNIAGMGLAGAAGMAIVVFVLAPFGDLSESLLKRDLGIKDMGSILPGHGGVLDRIDSVLFVAPGALMLLGIVFGG